MAEDSGYMLEALREEADFTLYRGRALGNPAPILALAVATQHPSPDSLQRLEHEWSLAAELDAAWAAQPLALTRYQGRAALILKDPGGEPLDGLINQHKGRPIDLTRFLRIAIGLAAALGQAHRQGLIHKDLKPANLLVDASGHVWLTGFGIASRLLRERQPPVPPEMVAGTLAYMAPEQTGRMNRSIDSRSDLYAVGVTFYQMLTGNLPFTAADPLEWVHCHIARQPIAPANYGVVPEPLSAIVMKLLAKNAEERYQTAAGLERDLRECQVQWQSYGRIDTFPLAVHDLSDRGLIAEKLYGRERESGSLLAAFDRVVAGGRPECVLVSGSAGIGKSTVVTGLHKCLVPTRGLLVAGKSDQYKRDIPYATLAQAFQSLIHPLLGQPEVELSKWRDDLRWALSPNGALLVDLVPELTLIIGEQPPVPSLPPQEAKTRSHLAFRRFISIFARPAHPLALFFDDLQWLDAATLDFLENLLIQQDLTHLLVIGAYRDDEVDAAHPLMRKLSAVREAEGAVHEVRLTPLAPDDLAHLIADSLHCDAQRAMLLAQLIHEKTGGNPFFATQFIRALVEEKLIAFEHGSAQWRWDLDVIHTRGFTDNVVDLMVAKHKRLPVATQIALQQLACIGNSAEAATLSTVLRTSGQETEAVLREALYAELIVSASGSYRFVHDRIQEAAYSLLAQEARAEAHLRIGRQLNAHLRPERREEAIFEIVNQLNRGAELITADNERCQLAELNLIASKRAKASTAYASALHYAIAGAALLTNDSWQSRHDLVFQMELQKTECEFLTGEVAVAAKRLDILRPRAADTIEAASATCLAMDIYMTLGQVDLAVSTCLDYMRRVGIDWPRHPTEEAVRREYEQIWRQLGSRQIEEIIDLPLISDPASIATLDVLTKVSIPAGFANRNLHALVICRAVSLSIAQGNNHGSCRSYVDFSIIAGHRFGDYKNAFRFAQLGYDLIERHGLKRFQAATYHAFAYCTMPWMKHLLACCSVMRRTLDVATTAGDLTIAAYSHLCLNRLLFAAGGSLDDLQREAEDSLAFARKAKFGIVVDMTRPQLALIRTLRGLTTPFGSFVHATFDETAFVRDLDSHPPMVRSCYWIRKLQAYFHAGEFASAVDASLKARSLLSISPGFEVAEYEFYGALARAACCDSATRGQRGEHLDALEAHYKQLEIWAEHCPENFANRLALAGAEIARIEGRALHAEQLYEDAIHSAQAHGFIHNEALANEVAARFYAARGFATVANAYLRNARNCYERWGADGKVRQLDARHPGLSVADARGMGRTPPSPDQPIDVTALVKASQTLSGEMLLPRLIERLMTIALQNAGAERGLLILMRDGEPRIEAEAFTNLGKIEIAARRATITPLDLPQSVLHYAMRTQQHVLLDDASSDELYSQDEYVQRRRSRSVLFLPIVKQAKMVGVLYLENNLTLGAFTPERMTMLLLLASQAAISLENAHLYSDLQLQAGLLQRLPVSAWTLNPDGTPDFVNQVWLDYSGQTLDFVRSNPEAWMTAVHPEDREAASQAFWAGVRAGRGFAIETRSLRAQDGCYRWHLQQAVPMRDADGKVLKFLGTTTDINEQKCAEDALRQAQADLARINRATTMGELAASLAHEITQPITGAIANASACLRWLDRDEPDLDETRSAVTNIVRDGQRASQIIARLRTQFEKGSLHQEAVEVSEIVRETVGLLHGEAARYDISVRTDLAAGLPQIIGDRVQLQQVAMNLIVNSIEAMKNVDGIREMVIRSQQAENGQILVSVCDTGMGVPPQLAEQIFDPFFTTKSHGTGMGLRISRSIVESHGGRLWASAAPVRGAVFQFTLPVAAAERH
jgi:PAS domain S-box-containing protein